MTKLQVEGRFSVVPEWVIDAEISDSAFRLYAVLVRYGQSSGSRMPSRSTLAARTRKSVDSVDRAMKELTKLGAVVVQRRRDGARNLTNRYQVLTSRPDGRTDAATLDRTPAARVAAPPRPDPDPSTETPPPAPPEVAEQCRAIRQRHGLPAALWIDSTIAGALAAAAARGWPEHALVPALFAIAADPATRSPSRLSAPGPWWATAEAARLRLNDTEAAELMVLEAELAEADGRRVWAQREARAQLNRTGRPITRLTVARTAARLLQNGADGSTDQPGTIPA
jgi:hypothetical protein